MTGLFIALGIGLFTMAAMLFVGRMPRSAWEITGAALLLGLAGYAWQGHFDLGGDPRKSSGAVGTFDEDLAERRRGLAERYGPAGQWLVMSDGLGRQGKTREAANVLLSGIRQTPNDPNLWVGMGNALVAHGGGILSPGADFAFRKAIVLAPDALAGRYFYGLALAQSGDLDDARKFWAPLAAQMPKDSKFRIDLEQGIAQIDAMLAARTPAGR